MVAVPLCVIVPVLYPCNRYDIRSPFFLEVWKVPPCPPVPCCVGYCCIMHTVTWESMESPLFDQTTTSVRSEARMCSCLIQASIHTGGSIADTALFASQEEGFLV